MSSVTPPNQDENGSRASRRAVLAAGVTTLASISLAGCLGDDEAGDNVLPDLPRIDDSPDGVYIPTHRESMAHLPTVHAGDYAVSPMITYPHRFWTVTGTETVEVRPEDRRGVHLMFTLWDPETEMVLPVGGGAQIEIRKDGTIVESVTPWPMISQTMGFHFGDNVVLPEDDTYRVTIDLPPIGIQKTGAFAGRFEERERAVFEFTYDATLRHALVDNVEFLEEDLWGRRGALEPLVHGDVVDVEAHIPNTHHDDHDDHSHSDDSLHDGHAPGHHHDMPFSSLPPADQYPGIGVGELMSHDARLVVRYIEETPFAPGAYFLVSPRTPYNRVPLADMALSVEGAVDGPLTQMIDPDLGLHYGIEASLSPGDDVRIDIGSPPQVSRHAGYETAFLRMDPIEVTLPE